MAIPADVGASYALSNGWEHEEERLGLLEAVLDPLTFARLSSLPVATGWRCLEVGAGTSRATVARLLPGRVSETVASAAEVVWRPAMTRRVPPAWWVHARRRPKH